jgi:hypothetical protein
MNTNQAKGAVETSFVAQSNQLIHFAEMAETQAPPPLPKSQPSFGRRHNTIIKLLEVGALVLVLLIPLVMITGVLSDRLSRRNEAVADITSSWGREQNVIGPVLGIPFQYKFKAVKEVPAPDGKWSGARLKRRLSGLRIFFRNRSGSMATSRRRRCIAAFMTRQCFARR